MKKKAIIFTITISISLLLSGCNKKDEPIKIDYSKYSFTDIGWARPNDNDTDISYIEFYSDGKFNYYCSCGSPIESYDLCTNYTYNHKEKTITLKCSSSSKLQKVIKIKSESPDKLELDFGNETRTFTKDNILNQT